MGTNWCRTYVLWLLSLLVLILVYYLYFYIIKKEITKKTPDYYIGVGLCFGVAFGALYDNIGLGIALGLVFGVAWQQNAKKKISKKQELPPKNN